MEAARLDVSITKHVDALYLKPGQWTTIYIRKPGTTWQNPDYHVIEFSYDNDEVIHIHTTEDFPEIKEWGKNEESL